MIRRSFLSTWLGAIAGLFAARTSTACEIDVTSLADTSVQTQLSNGAPVFQETTYAPATLNVQCGNITITNATGIGRGTVLLIDGVEARRVRKIVLTIAVYDAVVVTVEHLARSD